VCCRAWSEEGSNGRKELVINGTLCAKKYYKLISNQDHQELQSGEAAGSNRHEREEGGAGPRVGMRPRGGPELVRKELRRFPGQPINTKTELLRNEQVTIVKKGVRSVGEANRLGADLGKINSHQSICGEGWQLTQWDSLWKKRHKVTVLEWVRSGRKGETGK